MIRFHLFLSLALNPRFFKSNPDCLDSDNTGDKISAYADKFMFDVFFDVYRENYVGIDNGAS